MKETYCLLLSSQNANSRIGTTKNKLQFYVNWSAVLPKPADLNQIYKVRFTMTGLSQNAYSDVWSVNIDF